MTDADRNRNDYLVGTVASLEALCFALIETHHSAPALLAKWYEAKETKHANLLASASSQKTLEGFETTASKIDAAVSNKNQRQASHRIGKVPGA